MNSQNHHEPSVLAAWARRAATVGAVLGLGLTAALGVFAAPLTNSPEATPQVYSWPGFHAGGATDNSLNSTPNPYPATNPFTGTPLLPPYQQAQGTPTGMDPVTATGVLPTVGGTGTFATEIPSRLLGNYNPAFPPTLQGGSQTYANHFRDGNVLQIAGPFDYSYNGTATNPATSANTPVITIGTSVTGSPNPPADVQSSPAAINATEYPEIQQAAYFGVTTGASVAQGGTANTNPSAPDTIQFGNGLSDATLGTTGGAPQSYLHEIRQVVYFTRTETVPVVAIGSPATSYEVGGVPAPAGYRPPAADTEQVAAVYAMDGYTGGIIWRYQMAGFGNSSESTPTVARINVLDSSGSPVQHLVVIAADDNGYVYCLDAVGNKDGASNSNIVQQTATSATSPALIAYDTATETGYDVATNTHYALGAHVGTTSAYWAWRPGATTLTGTLANANSELPIPNSTLSASPAVYVRTSADTLGHNVGDAIIYIGNSNGVLYALNATGVTAASAAYNTPVIGTFGVPNPATNPSKGFATGGIPVGMPTCNPLWWFSVPGPNPSSGVISIDSAPAVYVDPAHTDPNNSNAPEPVVYIGTSLNVSTATSSNNPVGHVFAVDGLYGPRGNGGQSDPTTGTGPGSLDYNVGQRAFWAFPDLYGADYAVVTAKAPGYQNWSNNGTALVTAGRTRALGNITGSPVVFHNPDDGTTRLFFAANIGTSETDPVPAVGTTPATTATISQSDTAGRIWGIYINGSASVPSPTTMTGGTTTGPGGSGATSTSPDNGTPWSYPQANNPNDSANDGVEQPSYPMGGFLHATPAVGVVQYPKEINYADSATDYYNLTDHPAGTARTVTFSGTDTSETDPNGSGNFVGPSVPMLYVGTDSNNNQEAYLYALDLDGTADTERGIYAVLSPNAGAFQSSPALVVNPSSYTPTGGTLTNSGGNGGAVYITAANTLYQFQATPIASPVVAGAAANLYVPNDAAITGCGPISSPAIAATDIRTLPGNTLTATGGPADFVRDWVYVGDNTLGLCRGFTPGQTSEGTDIPYEQPIPPPNPATEATPIINYLPLRAYVFDGTTTGTNPHPGYSTDMTQANTLNGAALPAVFEWGTDAYIRFSNAVPPANPSTTAAPLINTGVTDSTAGATSPTGDPLLIDPTKPDTAYGSGQAIQFQTTDDPTTGQAVAPADLFTVPPIAYADPAAGNTTPLTTGFYQRTGSLTSSEQGAIDTILGAGNGTPNTAGAIGAFTYQIAYGANISKHNTPGARRRVINGTQRVLIYNLDSTSGLWTTTGQYASLETTNGTVTPPGAAPAATAAAGTPAATGTPVTVDQPTFGILNPLAVRGGGPSLNGNILSLGNYANGTPSDGIGPFRPIVTSNLMTAYSYDLQALSNGNLIYTQQIPPSGNGPTGGTAASGQNPGAVAQANTASAASYPQQNVTIITATGFINHGTQGDNTTGQATDVSPIGSGTTGNGIGTPNYYGFAGLDIADRSLIGLQPDINGAYLGLQIVVQPTSGLQLQDNTPTASQTYGAMAVINPLPWDDTTNIANRLTLGRNTSVDYPDIPRNAVTNEFANGSATLNTSGGGGVLPAASGANINTPSTYANRSVNSASVRVQINVPKYQPADLQEWDNSAGILQGVDPKTVAPNNTNVASRTVMGYVGTERVVANVRGTNATSLPNVFDTNNAYRDISVYTGVPVDMSTAIQNNVTDVGTVPHGFGIQMQGYTPDGAAFTPYNSYAGFAGHFMPLTIQNNGNTNLVNPHLDQQTQFYQYVNGALTAVGSTNPLPLLSDALDTGSNVPLSYIPAYDTNGSITGPSGNLPVGGAARPFLVRSSLDTDLVAAGIGVNPNFTATDRTNYPLGTSTITFHKPRVGDTLGTTLSVPDVPHDNNLGNPYYLVRAGSQPTLVAGKVAGVDTNPVSPTYNQIVPVTAPPYVSVAVPLGTPVGNYSNILQMYEGYDPNYSPLIGPTYSGTNILNTPLDVIQDKDANGNIEDQHGVQPTSKPGTQILVHVKEDRLTDSFTPGALPQSDFGPQNNLATNTLTGAADFAPAAYRDPATGDLSLYWTSSRFYNPATPTPPYSIVGTSLTFNGTSPYYTSNGVGNFVPAASEQSWWNPIADPYSVIANNGTGFGVAVNQNQNTGVPSGNNAYGFVSTVTGSGTTAQYAITCGQITNPANANSLGTTVQVASSTQPKSGVHGLAIANVSFPDATPNSTATITNNLWAFWTGGTRGRTALYYGSSIANGTPGPFTTPAVLPVPAGLVSVADANATSVLAPNTLVGGTTSVPAIEVTYSGVSAAGNSDVYVSRYRPYLYTPTGAASASVQLGLMRMPQTTELLQADPRSSWYQARDVGWARNGVLQVGLTVNSTTGGTVSNLANLVYQANPDSTVSVSTNGGTNFNVVTGAKVVFDRASGILVLTNIGLPNLSGNSIPGQSIFLDLASGRVRFSQPLASGTNVGGTGASVATAVTATFNPTARRITTSPTADTAPVAFLDQAYMANSSGVAGDANIEADRYWFLWHKDAVGKTNPALWYKTQRLTFALTDATGQPASILRNANGQPNATVTFNGNTVYTPGGGTSNVVDVDAARGRIYFPITLGGVPTEGQVVTVAANGGTTYSGMIHWLDEPRYNDTSNQSVVSNGLAAAAEDGALVPISNIANESGVTAFLDPVAYANTNSSTPLIPHNIWVFWTSTRNGTADIYYETLNPRFAPTTP